MGITNIGENKPPTTKTLYECESELNGGEQDIG